MAANDEIDTGSFTPAYYQLASILHGRIMDGRLRPGDRIPGENELGDEFGLSRMTARKAITVLADEGLVDRHRGRGTFVSKPKVEGGYFLIPDFHAEMRKQGLSSEVTLLGVEAVPAPGRAAEMLGINKGERILHLERMLTGEGEPLVYDRKYLLLDSSQPLLEAELGHGSIEELFSDDPDKAPVRADLELSVTNLTAREAGLLKSSKGSAAFRMEQLIYAASDRRIAWGWLTYRGDRFSFKSSSRLLLR